MYQTGSSFIIDDGKTYDSKGSKDVWCKSGQSGLDKHQCTVQLTVFADGVLRIKPLLIFRGKGLPIKNTEKQQWGRRVHVASNAWCDEDVMVKWVKDNWGSYFQNTSCPSLSHDTSTVPSSCHLSPALPNPLLSLLRSHCRSEQHHWHMLGSTGKTPPH